MMHWIETLTTWQLDCQGIMDIDILIQTNLEM